MFFIAIEFKESKLYFDTILDNLFEFFILFSAEFIKKLSVLVLFNILFVVIKDVFEFFSLFGFFNFFTMCLSLLN